MKNDTKTNDEPVEIRQKTHITSGMWAAAASAAVLIFIVGFTGGIFVGRAGANNSSGAQQSGDSSQLPGGMQGVMPNGQRMGMFGGGITGEVTEVSSSTITLKEERTGGLITYDITSDTEVTDNGDDAVIGDVKVGDTVQVQGTDDTDDTAAGTITLNPSTPTRSQFQ